MKESYVSTTNVSLNGFKKGQPVKLPVKIAANIFANANQNLFIYISGNESYPIVLIPVLQVHIQLFSLVYPQKESTVSFSFLLIL